jgi:tryptophan synthase beta chain
VSIASRRTINGQGDLWANGGSALALAYELFGLDCTVYMVKVSFDQKPYRKLMMQAWGANVFASPSDHTEFGRKMLQADPHCPSSLGIAISEAIEDAVKSQATKYSNEGR